MKYLGGDLAPSPFPPMIHTYIHIYSYKYSSIHTHIVRFILVYNICTRDCIIYNVGKLTRRWLVIMRCPRLTTFRLRRANVPTAGFFGKLLIADHLQTTGKSRKRPPRLLYTPLYTVHRLLRHIHQHVIHHLRCRPPHLPSISDSLQGQARIHETANKCFYHRTAVAVAIILMDGVKIERKRPVGRIVFPFTVYRGNGIRARVLYILNRQTCRNSKDATADWTTGVWYIYIYIYGIYIGMRKAHNFPHTTIRGWLNVTESMHWR